MTEIISSSIISLKALKKIREKSIDIDKIREIVRYEINRLLIEIAKTRCDSTYALITKNDIALSKKFDDHTRNIFKENWFYIMNPIAEEIEKEYGCALFDDDKIAFSIKL